MSKLGTSARVLLSELARFAGEKRLNARIFPMEWIAIAKKAGLSDQSRNEAIADLLKNKFIAFQPDTTQIIVFSPEGIETANQLAIERPKLEDPIPTTLDAIRSETAYWTKDLTTCDPGSNWWEWVQGRLAELRQTEQRLSTDKVASPHQTIHANFYGANARLNANSVDYSSNSASEIHAARAQSANRHSESRRILAPELQRTIDRLLYIHGRALANFVSHSADTKVKPTDLKQDFIPHWPKLFPNASQVRDLVEEDAAALTSYYDSLHALNDDVNDWWQREGQLPVNLFNMFLHRASKSLRLALVCIEKFDLETLIPPPYESWGTISFRINQALKSETEARDAHLARFAADARKSNPR
jgi:hypothetical protein